ncbi:probable serine/threonine-protein kinase DDB_G0282963 isoform X2 [Halyomorpha halys]|uniref:probable serine/threonine-protein kinase DDB_G0282963 isoform X2 n=1 Tax=Halyomorpha halys TaxID=286706 RepID=UPI0006D50643|nr:uncharacterized protein LOC106678122 isoform X2 [Halyomorpha halys]
MRESFLAYKLYCLHESDPNTIIDLSYFLCWNSAVDDKYALVHPEVNSRSDRINNTFSLQKAKCNSENRRTKLKQPSKKKIGAENLSKVAGNSTLLNTQPIQSAQINLNCNNDVLKVELDGTNLVTQLTIDESTNFVTKKSIDKVQDTTQKSSSNLWNISEHTLIANISAPKEFMDTSIISYSTSSSDCSVFSKFNFNPNSVSTPTKKLGHANVKEITITPENIPVPVNPNLVSTPSKKLVCANAEQISLTPESIPNPINPKSCITPPKRLVRTNTDELSITLENEQRIDANSTLEDQVNNTYNVSLLNEEINDIHLNTTTIISTSHTEIGKTADAIQELEPKSTLENTYIFDESNAEQFSTDNINVIANNIENLMSNEDNMNNKLDDPLNLPYDSESNFNSTITLKSKDDDSEDSCYSSSSNIRSLGDVCAMSQLQPQKNCIVDFSLIKTRSEDSLCLPEHGCSSRKPKKYYGSALNLGTHNINQLTTDRRLHQNPNYFLRKPGNQVVLPNVSLQESNAKDTKAEKAIIPPRQSKIPRLQSKIPKLMSKK